MKLIGIPSGLVVEEVVDVVVGDLGQDGLRLVRRALATRSSRMRTSSTDAF
jgi:hypothetical protein